jgi:hypothetical protein
LTRPPLAPDLRAKRDEAILRLMFTTGARSGDVVAMESEI